MPFLITLLVIALIVAFLIPVHVVYRAAAAGLYY